MEIFKSSILEIPKNRIKNLSSKLIEHIERHAMLQLFLYVAMASVIVALSIKLGPTIFNLLGYHITDENIIKASDAVSYFLQAFLAVVIAVFMTRSTENKKVDQSQQQNQIDTPNK
jgi:hypothetical protein